MTHAQKNASIGRYGGEGRGHIESWSHGETVGGAWPAHSSREGKAKKVKESQCLAKRSMKMHESKTKKRKSNATSERHRKLYPLRGRSEALSCHVLLAHLDNETKTCEVDPNRDPEHKKTKKAHKKAEKTREPLQKCLKTFDKPSAQEPRKRRLASLNAEALNSLLLEKTHGPPGAKSTKKQATTEQTKTCSKRARKSETCQNPKKDEAGVSLYAPMHAFNVVLHPYCAVLEDELVPPAVPRLLSTMSDRRQAEVRLQMGKECPQNTTPSHGSLTVGHSRSSQKHPTASAEQQRQATNGWRPVGVPTEKEVFTAGDDETVLRQCYEGVEREGEVIRVRDTVLVRSGPRKKSLPYVAKISALWEDPRTGELMMSLFWYYRPEHTHGGRDPSMHCENEIFASRHQDENSVACIEDRCYVLPLAQYCRFCALLKRCSEGVSDHAPLMPRPSDSAGPAHRLVPDGVDPRLVYLCRHVYDFRFGRILKNPQ
ncbi:bromo adjacent homology domain-containing 1 protein-like [Sinocyclocheilus grahami]|uniref:bromo adjacent homology domain-containing 1 protein-like n=1 Tax=Sinocyclocheilus grahami TaxID=75366 RepID=UPI0007AC9164|nr:PREDICTED: bromo adjacent homology domain-containing 1 protein-like [Sinocyclocheilus grahami]